MRYLPLMLTLAVASPVSAASVPIEPDAVMSNGISQEVIDPAVAMIVMHGWRCDSVSALRPFLMSRGFTIVCNRFSYTYNFEDRGGRWEVTLD